MANELPSAGRWAGYFLYGDGGLRHRMKLTLAFGANGAIDGDGFDVIESFLIAARFDVTTNAAYFKKVYVGIDTVEYSELYCQRAICGDWRWMGHSGGFCIWPESETAWEQAPEDVEIAEPVLTELGHDTDPVRGLHRVSDYQSTRELVGHAQPLGPEWCSLDQVSPG